MPERLSDESQVLYLLSVSVSKNGVCLWLSLVGVMGCSPAFQGLGVRAC